MRLLIVDEDPSFANVLAHELQVEGHTTEVRGSGGDAANLLANERFDAVVANVMLPDLDGLELVQRFGDVSGLALIIVASENGRVAVSMLPVARALGATATLVKPFGGPEVLNAIGGLH